MADPTRRVIAAPAGRLFPLPALAAVCLAACGPTYPAPPETARVPVVDTLHGVTFTDDYRWLEDQESAETRAWIAEQNAYAELIVGEAPLRTELEGRLRELMDVPGAIFPRRAGSTNTSPSGSPAAKSEQSTAGRGRPVRKTDAGVGRSIPRVNSRS